MLWMSTKDHANTWHLDFLGESYGMLAVPLYESPKVRNKSVCLKKCWKRWNWWYKSTNVETYTDCEIKGSCCASVNISGVTSGGDNRGFGLDDWIDCTLYIHTTLDYRQYSTIHYHGHKNPQTGPILIQLNPVVSLTSCFLHIITCRGVTVHGAWIGERIYCPLIITAPSLSSTLYKLPQHPLSLFQPAVISRSLATASNSGDSSASCVRVLLLPCLYSHTLLFTGWY
jgi:hypothetical protein